MPSPDRSGGPAPKLTAGQRLLLLLPRLQRPEPRPPATKPAPGRSKPGTTGPTTGPKQPPSPAGAATNGTATNGTAAKGRVDTTPAAAAPTLGARLRDSMLKPKPEPVVGPSGKAPTKADPYPEKSSAELKRWIRYLDDQERLYTLIAAPLGALLAITLLVISLKANPTVAAATKKHPHVPTNDILLVGGLGLLFSVGVLLGGLTRRRSLACFCLVFQGFGFSSSGSGIALIIPFWGLAAWLFIKTTRMQRALATRGDLPRQQRGRPAAGARGGGGRAGPTTGRWLRKKAPEPTGPTPSKRYTPPKPKDADR